MSTNAVTAVLEKTKSVTQGKIAAQLPITANLPAPLAPIPLPANVSTDFILTHDFINSYGADEMKDSAKVADDLLRDRDSFLEELEKMAILCQGLDPNKFQGIRKVLNFFKGAGSNAKAQFIASYRTIKGQLDSIEASLYKHVAAEEQSIRNYELMFDAAVKTYQVLDLLVKNGREIHRLQEIVLNSLPAPTDAMGAQQRNDQQVLLERFDKRVVNLDLIMTNKLQEAPSHRMAQNNGLMLVDQFNDLITLGIPAWKTSFAIYVNQMDQAKRAEVGANVRGNINATMQKNSELLKQNAKKIGEEAQKQVIDIETIEVVNKNLISTVQELRNIRDKGIADRKASAGKLDAMRQELVQSLSGKGNGTGVQAAA